MLEVRNLNVSRGGLQILWDVSLEVKNNEIVALLGSNGAGKTTLLSTLVGLLKPSSGHVLFHDNDVAGLPCYKYVNLGISFVPEDRKLFTNCTVRENLVLGAYSSRAKPRKKEMLSAVYEMFPFCEDRAAQSAVTLSGGEQRMLAIGRTLMADPEFLILDEPSQGLSPRMALEVFRTLERLRERGISIFLAEQNVNLALRFADRAYVMETGRITIEGKSSELLGKDHIREAFLGL
jgi:branched-chain amino acid transport system ATP-binding protein